MVELRVYPRVGGGTLSMEYYVGSNIVRRSIPAWAGEPAIFHRVCKTFFQGLSPRGRGNPIQPGCFLVERSDLRSIPAWAGEPGKTRHAMDRNHCSRVYPRVGGGTLVQWANVCGRVKAVYPRVGGGTWPRPRQVPYSSRAGLSPRGRGNRLQNRLGPRATFALGLSPRGRGNPPGASIDPFGTIPRRSIPAWAGEP